MEIETIKKWALDNVDYLFHDEMEINFEQVKWVKCRKLHECIWCGRNIKKGETALLDKFMTPEMPGVNNIYTCFDCIKQEALTMTEEME